MSLANDLGPGECLEVCQETMAKNLVEFSGQLLTPNDTPEQAAQKYVIMGARLRTILSYCKEALKAVEIGQDSTAFLLAEGQKHKPLEQFAEIKEMRQLLKENGATMEMKIVGGE